MDDHTKNVKNIIIIQAHIRGWLFRVRYTKTVLDDFDEFFSKTNNTEHPAINVFYQTKSFLFIWKEIRDKQRFERLCRYLIQSMKSPKIKFNYAGVFFIKNYSRDWIIQVKIILQRCVKYINEVRIQQADDRERMIVLLHVIVLFTSVSTWEPLYKNSSLGSLESGMQKLCNNFIGHIVEHDFYESAKKILIHGLPRGTLLLTSTVSEAFVTLLLRPLQCTDVTDRIISNFVSYTLTIPAFVYYINNISNANFKKIDLSQIINHLLNNDVKYSHHHLEANQILSIIANVTHLSYICIEQLASLRNGFMKVMITLTGACQECVQSQDISSLSHWHPILGWFRYNVLDIAGQDSLPHIKYQLTLLWSSVIIPILLQNPLENLKTNKNIESNSGAKASFKRALELPNIFSKPKLDKMDIMLISDACNVYYKALTIFTQLRLDILTGLCYQSNVIYMIWKYFLKESFGMKGILRLAELESWSSAIIDSNFNNEKWSVVLLLFNECMTHYITILDDVEMYEKQTPFTLSDFLQISTFLNIFIYKAIMNDVFSYEEENNATALFQSCHTLLKVLHMRDCRRRYAPPSHWLIKEIKISSFINNLEKNKKYAVLKDKMPHVIPYKDRVHLLKKHTMAEKTSQQNIHESQNYYFSSMMVKIRRDHIVEDAYSQLMNWPSSELKKSFRVKFVNSQGLDEAGIDQAGVFREFIEELMLKLFDVSLNLFERTSEGHLYPSPGSRVHDNHLQLMEFSGKMLAKALYENIVVDVQLASFFLNQVLGQTHSPLYSYIDDLPSLDAELYKNLMYIKHYEGDVSDLALTFCITEDNFGSNVNYELIPGGKITNVNNNNKIIYIHMMAHYKMYTRIKHQTIAFTKGFHSLLSKDDINMFSTPEFQLLISGENTPLNIMDLRQHTVYYGGFHDAHRVVIWLWEILSNEFTEEEKRLFLKFVTSSSKPPLLGFAYLQPSFAIRCVEVGEDEDQGDSIASVIRGFFTIRKRGPEYRLPTASTCFNLLKLPNYSKKSILRDKLRYAITSNTGFELS